MSRPLTIHQPFGQTRQLVHDGGDALERPETYSTLLRVVATITPDRCLQEDLLQEAVIHFWQLNNQRPGQSPSWYFKSCQLYLLNLLRKGRSIDSLKHRKGQIRLFDPAADDPSEGAGLNDVLGDSDSEESVFAQVSVRDILT